MSTLATSRRGKGGAEPRLRTIESVCEELPGEFPDISVSKIRYLEDQGLVAPAAHEGRVSALLPGRRRAPDDDPAPAAGRVPPAARDPRGARRPRGVGRASEAPQRGPHGPRGRDRPRRALRPRVRAARLRPPARGVRRRRLARRGRASTCTARARRRSSGRASSSPASASTRHLRTFLTAAGRRATLVEQVVAPGLRSRNPERRKGALDDLEALARVSQELSHLLFLRDLRAAAERA